MIARGHEYEMPTLIVKKILTPDTNGYAFITLKQASGIVPTLQRVDVNRTSYRRDKVNDAPQFKPIVTAREAAAGGSDLTLTLYVARSTNRGSVTLPDVSNASSFGWQYVSEAAGPFWSDDDQSFRDADTTLYIFRVVAL